MRTFILMVLAALAAPSDAAPKLSTTTLAPSLVGISSQENGLGATFTALAQVIRGADRVPQPPQQSPLPGGAENVPPPPSARPSAVDSIPRSPSPGVAGQPLSPQTSPSFSSGPDGPKGSFRQTCKDVRMDGSLLLAVCKQMEMAGIGGGWRAATLDVSNCYLFDDISNENGYLDCSPPGSYKQTCFNRQTNRLQDAITADCWTSSDVFHQSRQVAARLDNVSTCMQGTIQNLDGILACDRR